MSSTDADQLLDDFLQSVEGVHEAISPLLGVSPLIRSEALSTQTGLEVFLKCENQMPTGSFKVRGAMAKLLQVLRRAADGAGANPTGGPIDVGFVTASSGNHGMAVAHGLAQLAGRLAEGKLPGREGPLPGPLRVTGVIVLPENANPVKVAALEKLLGTQARVAPIDEPAMRSLLADAASGLFLLQHGLDCSVTEAYALRLAAMLNLTYISPYNDPDIITGQATVGLELARDLANMDAVYVCVGGGGLAAGVAAALKSHPSFSGIVIGCLPAASPVISLSLRRGAPAPLDLPDFDGPTLSDGSAGGVDPDSLTYPLCRRLVDAWRDDVSEEQIAGALRLAFRLDAQRVEGAAGVALAALLADSPAGRSASQVPTFAADPATGQGAALAPGMRVAVILCGGNISDEVFRGIVGPSEM